MAADNPGKGEERRRFLAGLLRVAVISGIAAPLAAFLKFHLRKPPRLVTVAKRLRPGGFILEPDFIIIDSSSGPVALSRRCTHLGCRLNFNEEKRELVCPCHHSRFSAAGKRIAGPARRNLARFPLRRLGDGKGFVVEI